MSSRRVVPTTTRGLRRQREPAQHDDDDDKKRWLRRRFPWIPRPSAAAMFLPVLHRHRGRDGVHQRFGPWWNPPTTRQTVILMTIALLSYGILRHLTRDEYDDDEYGDGTMPSLDFVVAGFPKCGTTTLLYALRRRRSQSRDVIMSRREVCAMKDRRRPEGVVRRRYRDEITRAWDDDEGNDDPTHRRRRRQRGIKCPTILYSDRALDRLFTWYPNPTLSSSSSSSSLTASSSSASTRKPLRWIIGMRHPLRQVQSYYNYLVTEVYDKGYWLYKGIHTLESIIIDDDTPSSAAMPWKDMAYDTHRYEVHLERLLSRLLQQQQRDQQSTANTRPLVFLYTVEQLQNATTTKRLQTELSDFVGLSSSSSSSTNSSLTLGHENRNRFTGAHGHAETIDLCDQDRRFDTLRARLLRDSRNTAAWIERHLLSSSSPYRDLVRLGGGGDDDAWRTLLQAWKRDICPSATAE